MRLFLRTAFVIGAIVLVRRLLDDELRAPAPSPERRKSRSRTANNAKSAPRLADSLSASTAISDGEVAFGKALDESGEDATVAVAAPSLRRKRPLPKMDR